MSVILEENSLRRYTDRRWDGYNKIYFSILCLCL